MLRLPGRQEDFAQLWVKRRRPAAWPVRGEAAASRGPRLWTRPRPALGS